MYTINCDHLLDSTLYYKKVLFRNPDISKCVRNSLNLRSGYLDEETVRKKAEKRRKTVNTKNEI